MHDQFSYSPSEPVFGIGIMSSGSSLLTLTATFLVIASGAFLVLQQRRIASRLFCAGCVVAVIGSLASIHDASTGADRMAVLATLVVAAGLCAILIFKVRRRATYFVAAGIAGWLVASTFKPTINWLFGHWWIVPIALLVPCAAAFIARMWLNGARDQPRGARRGNSASRFISQLLDHLGGGRRGWHRRNRHIGDFGTTKRSRRGAGPNMI
jgi:hypothetical protein